MNKIKNFIYNISDILAAFIIIAAALLIIGWRVDAIMDYPNEISVVQTEDKEKDASVSKDADADTAESQNTSDSRDTAKDQNSKEGQTTAAAPVAVTIAAGSTVPDIANALVSAGAISDPQQFIDAVNAAGAATKLKFGAYTIPVGTTPAQIVQMMI